MIGHWNNKIMSYDRINYLNKTIEIQKPFYTFPFNKSDETFDRHFNNYQYVLNVIILGTVFEIMNVGEFEDISEWHLIRYEQD